MTAANLCGGELVSIEEGGGGLLALSGLEIPACYIEQVAGPALAGKVHEITVGNVGSGLNDPAAALHIR